MCSLRRFFVVSFGFPLLPVRYGTSPAHGFRIASYNLLLLYFGCSSSVRCTSFHGAFGAVQPSGEAAQFARVRDHRWALALITCTWCLPFAPQPRCWGIEALVCEWGSSLSPASSCPRLAQFAWVPDHWWALALITCTWCLPFVPQHRWGHFGALVREWRSCSSILPARG